MTPTSMDYSAAVALLKDLNHYNHAEKRSMMEWADEEDVNATAQALADARTRRY